jgi:DNA-binding HxlR family transcriptional regulator
MVKMNDRAEMGAFCPAYHYAVELIGRRWTGAIMRALYSGDVHRFSEITKIVPGLSDRLLSERLKVLEHEGLVTRTVYPDTPVRIEYCLTEKGEALGEVMRAIADWAENWITQEDLPNSFIEKEKVCQEVEALVS